MNKRKYTPGPWEASRDGPNRRWLVNADDFGVATCDGPWRNQEADARLIAAAPELLNSLRTCLLIVEHMSADAAPDTIKEARAAIAKATGEQA